MDVADTYLFWLRPIVPKNVITQSSRLLFIVNAKSINAPPEANAMGLSSG
eukprot:Nitzschia sp. Nitz4//scaffold15_size197535//6217//6388//NITZ4_001545-RA/size197535-est2genome-gene-0.181-mRNA-1//-1//CDS//3329537616//9218//frame0